MNKDMLNGVPRTVLKNKWNKTCLLKHKKDQGLPYLIDWSPIKFEEILVANSSSSLSLSLAFNGILREFWDRRGFWIFGSSLGICIFTWKWGKYYLKNIYEPPMYPKYPHITRTFLELSNLTFIFGIIVGEKICVAKLFPIDIWY